MRIRWEREKEGIKNSWDEGLWECVARMERVLEKEQAEGGSQAG